MSQDLGVAVEMMTAPTMSVVITGLSPPPAPPPAPPAGPMSPPAPAPPVDQLHELTRVGATSRTVYGGNFKPGVYDRADSIIIARAGKVFLEKES